MEVKQKRAGTLENRFASCIVFIGERLLEPAKKDSKRAEIEP